MSLITITNLAKGTNSGNSNITTSSISPSYGSIILVAVASRLDGGHGGNVPSVSGLGLTFNQIATENDPIGTQGMRVTLFYAVVNNTNTGTLAITFSSQVQSNIWYSIEQVIGVDVGLSGANAIVQNQVGNTNGSSLSISLSALSNSNNRTYGVFVSGGGGMTAGGSFASLALIGGQFLTEQAVNVNPVNCTFTGSNDCSGIAIELKAANPTNLFQSNI